MTHIFTGLEIKKKNFRFLILLVFDFDIDFLTILTGIKNRFQALHTRLQLMISSIIFKSKHCTFATSHD